MGRSCRSDSPELKLEMATDTGLDCQSDRLEKPGLRPIWRWVQSAANPSPCYLANIRVIFENNSEPVAKKAKRPCGAGTSDHRANFDNREKQGGSLQSNTVLPAKSRERKDRAAKPPTSPASRLHGCPRLPPHTTRLVFVRQGVGRFKAGRRYHSLIWDAVSSWRLPRRSSRSLPQGSLSASRLNGFCLPGANGQFLATHDDLAGG